MNTNTNNHFRAQQWAQDNANISGNPRWLHMWNGTYHVSISDVKGAERVDPDVDPLETGLKSVADKIVRKRGAEYVSDLLEEIAYSLRK